MSGGDGVSSLNDLNEKYKQWVKNRIIEGGTTGTCNADSLYTSSSVIDGTDTKRVFNYYLCDGGASGQGRGKCVGWNNEQWIDNTWGNCLKKNGSEDPCSNMAVDTSPGVSDFDMGDLSGTSESYDPVNNVCVGASGLFGDERADSTCRIGNIGGVRPAYPNNANEIDKIKDLAPVNNTRWLHQCPTGFTRKLDCAIDGDGDPGCGFVSEEDNDDWVGDKVRFCARNPTDYLDEHVANCCLGSLAGGPEVDTEGNPISTDYKSCPREFCVSRIAEGTESGSAGVNCDDPKTDKNASNVDETFCYKMSNECNTFFAEKCQDAFNDDGTDHPLKQQCKHWAHIQPQDFVSIANKVCNINTSTNDYVDERAGRPTSSDLRHVKSVLNRPLCREYITSTENYPIESQKLKNLCKHYMQEQDDGSWEAQESLDHDNVLENICGCHYPSGYYTWYNRRYETREAGTCQDSEGNALNAISRSECESGTPPGTWTPDAGAASITAALSDMMKGHPQCYYDKCISSMLYDVHNDAIPCAQNLQLCYQQMTQNNVMVGQDGNLSELPDMSALTGRAQQTCNQSTLSAPPPPSSDVGDGDGGGGGGFLSGIFGGSDDGSGDGTGDGSDNTNMIILIVVILLIVIIGVVVVVVLNKGKSTPQEIVVQQPLAA